MHFERDPKESAETFAVRGIDFEFAVGIFDSRTVDELHARRDYGEVRIVAFGLAQGIPIAVVYTDRTGRMVQSFAASSALAK